MGQVELPEDICFERHQDALCEHHNEEDWGHDRHNPVGAPEKTSEGSRTGEEDKGSLYYLCMLRMPACAVQLYSVSIIITWKAFLRVNHLVQRMSKRFSP